MIWTLFVQFATNRGDGGSVMRCFAHSESKDYGLGFIFSVVYRLSIIRNPRAIIEETE